MTGLASLSLERKLPLLISVLLIGLAGGLTAAGYHEVRQTSELRGIDRMQRMTAQLAQISSANIQQRFDSLRTVAADPAVVSYLAGSDTDDAARGAAAAALGRLSLTPTDTPIVAELRSVRAMTSVATRPELAGDEEPVAALIRKLATGQPAMGDFYDRGDSVFFWLGAPVTGGNRLLGYLLLRRAFAANQRSEQVLRELNGNDSISILFASDSGTTWASLTGRPIPVPALEPQDGDAPNVVRYTRDSGQYVGVYAHIANTPVRMIAEVPYSTLLERPSAYLRRSVAVALAMVLIGILSAWWLSRRITRPLRGLTVAAEAISTGHYGHRADVGRRDETGRLAEAFNTMAEQVQRSHDHLERQIAESRSLATRLSEANRAKADFLATMSHELRTPLNAIGGYVELIELGIRGPVTDDQRGDLERVRYNQRHLLALIGNILDFTRLDANKLPFDMGRVRADVVVNEVLDAVSPLLDEKKLRRECVGCDAPVSVSADRARLEQILLNLLSNAVRFTPPGGRITLAVAERDGLAQIAVADTGPGVPTGKLEAIFEPFYQVESGLTRTVGGTGLGLTISRALARAMGGDLTASSDGENGATFTVTLRSANEPETLTTGIPSESGRVIPSDARDLLEGARG
jgi:signal transduction histidine kinase